MVAITEAMVLSGDRNRRRNMERIVEITQADRELSEQELNNVSGGIVPKHEGCIVLINKPTYPHVPASTTLA